MSQDFFCGTQVLKSFWIQVLKSSWLKSSWIQVLKSFGDQVLKSSWMIFFGFKSSNLWGLKFLNLLGLNALVDLKKNDNRNLNDDL